MNAWDGRLESCCRALAALLLLAIAPPLRAQSEESEAPPLRGEFEPAPLPPPEGGYLMPDLPHESAKETGLRSRWFELKWGLVAIVDYSAFGQDDESLAQVGEQESQWDDRAARLMLRGTIGREYKVGYLVAGEYKGFESEPDETWQMTDISLSLPLGGPQTKLTIGKSKQTFSYEMVGDAANLPQQERVLSPFFVSRSVGAKISRVFGTEQRMTLSGGVFNDGWLNGSSAASGTDLTVRLTGLALDSEDGRSFFHLGFAGRYVGDDGGILRYRGRPESNVTDFYVDTGALAAKHAHHWGFEALWNEGPVSVLAEYIEARVSAEESGDPRFAGWYVAASWVMTGETRPYDRTVGYARRVMPTRRWGAPELVARYSVEDLDDGAVAGGSFRKTYFGLNWWATRRWKAGIGWGRTELERNGLNGTTDSLQMRLQWIY